MNFLRNIGIKAQLSLAFGLVLTATLILAAFSVACVNHIEQALYSANSIRNTELEPLYAAREALAQTGIAARNAYVFKDLAAATRELDLVDAYKADYLATLSRLDPVLGRTPQYAKVKAGMLAMAQALERPRAYRNNNELDAFGLFLTEECSPLRRQIVSDIDVLVRSLQEQTLNTSASATAQAQQARLWISGLSTIAVVLCAVVAVVLVRNLLNQLGGEPAQATQVAQAIASGRLYHPVDTSRAGAASMIYAMNTMRSELSDIVRKVRHGTGAIVSASSEIALGNSDLATRTEAQAAALAQVAGSMKQLVESVHQNAEYARQASALADAASNVSVEGNTAVEEVVTTMALIHESSRKIAEIISVIDGIAFQTNILALNAAVEAARAGEQGRGFAVVAGEVRNLAHRSAAAAKEIKMLIEDSVAKVNSGTTRVNHAGTTLYKVVGDVKRVTDIISHITSATVSQRADIGRVDSAITKLDDMTLQNTALVEEASAAAESLHDQAAQLDLVVRIFQLEQNEEPRQLRLP